MKQEGRNYVIVGSFVIGMLTALIVWIAFVSGRTSRTESYYIEYKTVMGLSDGTQIYYQGFPVGLIEGISRVRDDGEPRFRVDVSVRRDYQIPDDSIAEITASGLLSAVVIDIREGDSETYLAPGSRIPSRDPVSLFAAMTELLDQEIRPLVARFYVSSDPIMQNVEDISAQLRAASERVNDLLSRENTSRVARILENMEKVTNEVAAVTDGIQEVGEDVDKLISAVSDLITENEDELERSLKDVQHTLEAIARHIDAITSNLEGTSRNMNEFSRQVRQDPSLVIRGRSKGDGATTN